MSLTPSVPRVGRTEAGKRRPRTGDYGSLASITINSGSTTGTGTVTTTEDDDTDNETFTVTLGNLPSSVTAGSPNSVEITITDVTPPSMSLSAFARDGGGRRRRGDGPSSEDFSFDAPQMGVITILDGETRGTLTLTATDDDLVEGNESLTLNGSGR